MQKRFRLLHLISPSQTFLFFPSRHTNCKGFGKEKGGLSFTAGVNWCFMGELCLWPAITWPQEPLWWSHTEINAFLLWDLMKWGSCLDKSTCQLGLETRGSHVFWYRATVYSSVLEGWLRFKAQLLVCTFKQYPARAVILNTVAGVMQVWCSCVRHCFIQQF